MRTTRRSVTVGERTKRNETKECACSTAENWRAPAAAVAAALSQTQNGLHCTEWNGGERPCSSSARTQRDARPPARSSGSAELSRMERPNRRVTDAMRCRDVQCLNVQNGGHITSLLFSSLIIPVCLMKRENCQPRFSPHWHRIASDRSHWISEWVTASSPLLCDPYVRIHYS